MPRQTPRTRPQRFIDVASIASFSLLDFLVPAFASEATRATASHKTKQRSQRGQIVPSNLQNTEHFFDSLARVAKCPRHRVRELREVPSCTPPRAAPTASRQSFYGADQRLTKPAQHVRQICTSTRRLARPDPGGSTEQRSRPWAPINALRNVFDTEAKRMESHSHLPKDFFDDVFDMQLKMKDWHPDGTAHGSPAIKVQDDQFSDTEVSTTAQAGEPSIFLTEQLKLLNSVRDLEQQLAKAKHDLNESLRTAKAHRSVAEPHPRTPVILTKDDYLGLVDLYYYSHRDRFHPEGKDYSPSPLFLEDYTFKLSSHHEQPRSVKNVKDDLFDGEEYESPLREIEKTLLNNQRREIDAMQEFVDILLKDTSSNRWLFIAYKKLPHPGVAYLPRGIIRLFLQRMSTPWVKSHGSMIRYLSLIDDMQEAGLPITAGEWSSAIYLAGRSMSTVSAADVSTAISMWRKMEHDAGVKATHVTFNILFDIAVRAGKYALAENIMKEMFDRDLRLNRLGRVSLIYYHGIRADGDAIRRTYRDFVDAGEIVDTLVLNCVIAALLNAQEPSAAEQVYERMKDLQKRLESGERADGSETFYIRYPAPGDTLIGRRAASNELGRILLRSSRLKEKLPDHHAELQGIMPLRPNHLTFRPLIAYHANVSSDLDRVTVLLKEMTEDFDIPMRNVFYTLIFKGFALHARPNNSDESWSSDRLELVWAACRKKIEETRQTSPSAAWAGEQTVGPLPKLSELEAAQKDAPPVTGVPDVVAQKRLDPWSDFVLDLAVFPRQRRKPIERVHAQLFDETFYPLGNQKVDREEGEYVLPSPAQTAMGSHYRPVTGEEVPWNVDSKRLDHSPEPDSVELEVTGVSSHRINSDNIGNIDDHPLFFGLQTSDADRQAGSEETPDMDRTTDTRHNETHKYQPVDTMGGPEAGDEMEDDIDYHPHTSRLVTGDRSTYCWLLRAYTRTTFSRAKVEEVYYVIRKLWFPESIEDRMTLLKVLERCLRDCDRFGGHML